MSKARPIEAPQESAPLFDMSKATPIQQPDILRGATQATKISAAPKPFTKDWFKGIFYNQIADPATQALPAAGAMAGGIAGGAASGGFGAVGGAGIGGMGGEAAKQLIRRQLGFGDAPTTPEEAAKRITMQGGVQGGIQGVTEGLPFLAGPLQRAATTQYERALAPTTKINKAITKDITPELIKRGERGSLEGLEKRAGQRISELNPQLNQAYREAGSIPMGSGGSLPGAKITGAGNQIIADLEKLKQSYQPEGITAQPQAVSAIEGMQNIVKKYGPDISPDSLRRLRQIFEEAPAKAGAYAGADLSTSYTLNAQDQAANSIRGILNKNPDIGTLNKEISFWLDVQRVTSQSGLRRTGQEGGLMRVLSPLAAGTAAATTGMHFGGVAGVEAGTAAALTTAAYQAMRSPTWRTTSAVLKDRFAQALARGDIGAATALLGRFGIATQGRGRVPSPQAPTTQQSQIPGSQP